MIGSPYLVRGPIAAGGNATVVRAVDVRDGTAVALKLRPRAALGRLERELAVLRAVAHPRIATS